MTMIFQDIAQQLDAAAVELPSIIDILHARTAAEESLLGAQKSQTMAETTSLTNPYETWPTKRRLFDFPSWTMTYSEHSGPPWQRAGDPSPKAWSPPLTPVYHPTLPRARDEELEGLRQLDTSATELTGTFDVTHAQTAVQDVNLLGEQESQPVVKQDRNRDDQVAPSAGFSSSIGVQDHVRPVSPPLTPPSAMMGGLTRHGESGSSLTRTSEEDSE